MTLEQIAADFDCSIHHDSAGDVAMLRRLYNNLGEKQVRYSPDPCDFHPVERWETSPLGTIEDMLC
jgi:hypothetical protein